jgi:serine/threonine protein phosphatase 1
MFSFFKEKPLVEPKLPDNLRLYCIGDIHGRDDLLLKIHSQIISDQLDYEGQVKIIYVGDYVDRGMHSKQVINFLTNKYRFSEQSIFLRGNHEQVLLDFLEDDAVGPAWLAYGGQATLASYGVLVTKILTKRQDYIEIQQAFKDLLPESHLQFFKKTVFSYREGSYFFVHAGVNPKHSITRQKNDDLMWIRDAFISSSKNYEKIVVHGHTISDQPDFRINRIGIDTGAFVSGVLTCLVLEGSEQRVLQT